MRANRNVVMQTTLQMTMASSMPARPPQGPLGRKNSANSRPVASPPPITTALKAKPGSRKRWNQDGVAFLTSCPRTNGTALTPEPGLWRAQALPFYRHTAGTVARQPQRTVEIYESRMACHSHGRRDGQRGADHAADHDPKLELPGPIEQ